MRADRLLSILLLLQTRGRMTARELAEQLEVSERTIYRDIEALSTAGIPVYAERGPGGGCTLLDGYQTRLTGLTEAEVRALFLLNMAGPLADLGLSKALDDALLKLSAALPAAQRHGAEQVRQRIHLDTTESQGEETMSHLQTIQEAIWQDRKLVLTYCESNGTLSQQLVEPFGLVSQANAWYLVGAVVGERQVFRVSRVQAVSMTEEQFTLPASFDLPLYWAEYRSHLTADRPPGEEARAALKEKKGFKSLSASRQHPQTHQKKGCARRRQPKQKKGFIISGRHASLLKKQIRFSRREKKRLLFSIKKLNFPVSSSTLSAYQLYLLCA